MWRWWDERVVPRLADRALRSHEVGEERRVARTGLDGQQIAAGDETYDSVLTTFTLCTVPDDAAALAEARRVLRPGGTLRFLEHGLSPEPGVARWQHRLDRLQGWYAAGCHLVRDVTSRVDEAGLALRGLDQHYLPGPAVNRPWAWISVGSAVRED